MEKNITVEELITALTNIDDNTAIESIIEKIFTLLTLTVMLFLLEMWMQKI